MLERLIALSLRNRLLVGLALVVLVAVGSWAAATIPIDAFPDVTNVQVEVVSTAPGLSPLEIERMVTYPIESSMRGVPGLVTMRSVTKYGISVVTLVFEDDIDIYFARQQVFQRLGEVSLPEGAETEMGPVATAMGEIYQYTLEHRARRDGAAPGTAAVDRSSEPVRGVGSRAAPEEVARLTKLRTLQDWVVAPLLKGVSGVTEVNSFGGYIHQFEVLVRPDRLLEYGISVAEIEEAIRRNNANVGGSVVSRGAEEYIIRGVGMIRDEADIRSIVLRSEGGTPVLIGDVAEVAPGHAVRQGASLADGRGEAVGGIVLMLRGENSRQVSARLEARVREINESRVLPDGIQLVPFYRRAPVIEASTRTVLKALAEGSLLVLAVLLVLLRSVRGAVVVILALPLSVLLTFTVLRTLGIDANLMTLGGLAISIGMIIDATIIQVENVQRRLGTDPGRGRRETVLAAAMEVRKPSILGELIIALTFVPIVTLGGMEGKMFSPLAITVAVALLSSLLLSIFVIPVLCLALLAPDRRESPVLNGLRRLYRPALAWTIAHRVAVLVLGGVLVLGSLALVPRLGTEFLPAMDEGSFDMDVQLLPGVSLDQALETTLEVERRLMQFPELLTVVSRTGQTGVALEARGVDKTGFVGALRPRSEWTTAGSREALMGEMREAVEDIPGMVSSFSQPIQCRIDELVAGTRAQVIAKLYGDDLRVLRHKAGEIARVLAEVPGVADLAEEKVAGQPYLTVSVDRGKIARHGLNAADVLGLIETAVGGRPVSQVLLENQVSDVAIRLPEEHRRSAEALRALLVETPAGGRLPVGELASVEVEEGPVQISREDGRRRIGVEMNVAGRDIGGFVGEARERVRSRVELPPGYFVEWGGQFENQQQAMRRLGVIAPAVAALIFVLLLVTLGSVRSAVLVIFNLPFALAGGVLALWTWGLYLSVPASVGFIVLFGVAVLNGLVLISAIAQLRAEGRSVEAAVAEGCDSRLRPVLMTASIAIFSLLPMVFATGPGAEVQRPLAVVVVGGLITSTLLTLLVLPALYGWFERDGGRGNAEGKGQNLERAV
ncbi:MAG TPA: CusA/CzcA family heavy metal efflux RND transporter [Vicinamibacterales bacterium]|nr:CusA/CzcA family heavy metal efflux RND transporter [Vicinamibacterales bacterium]